MLNIVKGSAHLITLHTCLAYEQYSVRSVHVCFAQTITIEVSILLHND